MIRSSILALSLCAAGAVSGAAGAVELNYVDSGLFVPTAALQYAGFIAHGGVQTHTFLGTTYFECQQLLQASIDKHTETTPHNVVFYYGAGHPATYTYEPCTLRGAFEMRAPTESDDDSLTISVTIPARYARDLGELRKRYRYDQYLADYRKMFPAD
jgi:hypothetical protein